MQCNIEQNTSRKSVLGLLTESIFSLCWSTFIAIKSILCDYHKNVERKAKLA
jgi:hypothetical protein